MREIKWIPHKPEFWPFRYAILKRDVKMEDYSGYWKDKEPVMINQRIVKKGTKVKINMYSRFGDVGITDDLNKEKGYHARIELDDLKECK